MKEVMYQTQIGTAHPAKPNARVKIHGPYFMPLSLDTSLEHSTRGHKMRTNVATIIHIPLPFPMMQTSLQNMQTHVPLVALEMYTQNVGIPQL
jgi:hypothetical protein